MTWYQNWPSDAGNAEQSGVQSMPNQSTAGVVVPPTPVVSQGAGSVQQPGAFGQSEGDSQSQQAASIPTVDVVESASDVVVYVDVPGFEKDQLEIHADANRLYVVGDRSEAAGVNPEQGEHALVAERPVRIERTIPLPVHIDPEQVKATHENGVCEILVPKDESERRHQIGFQ